MKKILGTLVILSCIGFGFCFPMIARATMSTHVTQGMASYYSDHHHGRKTASGEIFNMHALTAAHRTYPLGTKLKVTNVKNGKSVQVKVNDRGPYAKGRILDLSKGAAKQIGMIDSGIALVRIERLSK